jgi:hypothetical protein
VPRIPTPLSWETAGRYRTNVWDYAGVNTLRRERREELAMHPTVKPVALVADAIKDCSRRGKIMLDPFGGLVTVDHTRGVVPSQASPCCSNRLRALPCINSMANRSLTDPR